MLKLVVMVLFSTLSLAFFVDQSLAGSVTVTNCTKYDSWVGLYNSNDSLAIIASTDVCLKPGQRKKLTCATPTCLIGANDRRCLPTIGKYTSQAVSGNYLLMGDYMDLGDTCP
jgi:hypothetical protein